MGLDGREELIRYITETRLDLVIGIVGQYLECFDSKSCFKLLNYICVSYQPRRGMTMTTTMMKIFPLQSRNRPVERPDVVTLP